MFNLASDVIRRKLVCVFFVAPSTKRWNSGIDLSSAHIIFIGTLLKVHVRIYNKFAMFVCLCCVQLLTLFVSIEANL